MSENNEFETGYVDDNTVGQPSDGTGGPSGFGAPTASGKKVKKGSKLPLIIFAVLAVVLLAGGAFVMFGGTKSPAPKPKPKPAIEAPVSDATPPAADVPATDPLATNPVADPTAAAAGQTLDPITGLPVTDPAMAAQPALDPVTGLPVTDQAAPAQATPGVDPVTGLPVSVAPPVADPNAAVPGAVDPNAVAPNVDPSAAAVPAALDPVTGLPVGTPVEQVAPVATPVASVPAPSVGNDPLAAFRDMLAPIDGRVTTLENGFKGLQSTVSDLSGKVDRLLDRPSNSNAIPVSRPAKKRVYHAPKKAKPANYVRSADSIAVQPPVSRVVIVSSSAQAEAYRAQNNMVRVDPVRSVEAPVAEVAAPRCNLQAIVPGRVWVKNADGSFASYGEGDRWAGRSVGTIDPARGVQLDARWTCN
jgi:hypothetical protein